MSTFCVVQKGIFFELKMSSFKYKHYHFLLKWWRFHWHHLPFKFPFWTQNIAICWLFYENLSETMKKNPRKSGPISTISFSDDCCEYNLPLSNRWVSVSDFLSQTLNIVKVTKKVNQYPQLWHVNLETLSFFCLVCKNWDKTKTTAKAYDFFRNIFLLRTFYIV